MGLPIGCTLAAQPLRAADPATGIDLAERYPAAPAEGAPQADAACPWTFTAQDVYELTGYRLSVGPSLRLEIGHADLGIGHCAEGAVWAVVIPRGLAWAASSAADEGEAIDHVWVRFHPSQIERLFPRDSIAGVGDDAVRARMLWIAANKMPSSWHVGNLAWIPSENQGTVDFDTRTGRRRFFAVTWQPGRADHVPAFDSRAIPPGRPISEPDAAASFDALWAAFDREYAMFVLRPDVIWRELRERYRPAAHRAGTREALAAVCADMLRQLRDLHVGVSIDGWHLPGYERPRPANANPAAVTGIVGGVQSSGTRVAWARTGDDIGYVSIAAWDDAGIAKDFDTALERLRDTRALIVDVRLNGGGDERLAQAVAGRFTEQEVVYAYSRYRNGPEHRDLTEKMPRRFSPRGDWTYRAPVIVLIGPECMSSTESFIAMLGECPQVTTMGSRTAGSSGNPRALELPAGFSVSLPRWIDYLADGEPLDGRGVAPDLCFEPGPGAFEGQRDDLLAAALDRLRNVTKPETKPGHR